MPTESFFVRTHTPITREANATDRSAHHLTQKQPPKVEDVISRIENVEKLMMPQFEMLTSNVRMADGQCAVDFALLPEVELVMCQIVGLATKGKDFTF